MKLLNSFLLAICVFYSPADSIGSGDYVSVDQAPFYVALAYQNNSFFCGGSIISDYWILTAAHCTDYNARKVIAGRSNNETEGSGHEIEKIFVYGDYAQVSFLSAEDIALLKLKKPIAFDEWQQPIKMSHHLPVDGSQLTIYGMGYENAPERNAAVLKKTQMSVLNRDDCENMVEEDERVSIAKSMMCAIGNSTQPCPADSGGPTIFDGKLVGLVGWGPECRAWSNRHKRPVVGFTRIDIYYDWIFKLTGIQY